jgi:amino acid permease
MKLSGLIEEQSDKALEIQSLTSFENTKSTFIVSLINSFKSLICTGILILPYIFYTGGYLLCTIFLFVIAIAIGYTCILFHEVIE